MAVAANNNAQMPLSADHTPSSPRLLVPQSAGANVGDVKDVAAATLLCRHRSEARRQHSPMLRGRTTDNNVGIQILTDPAPSSLRPLAPMSAVVEVADIKDLTAATLLPSEWVRS